MIIACIKNLLFLILLIFQFSTIYSQENDFEHIIDNVIRNSGNGRFKKPLAGINNLLIYADHASSNEYIDLSGFINHHLKVAEQNRRVGIGIMLGEPSGLNIKWWCNQPIDFEAIMTHYRCFY